MPATAYLIDGLAYVFRSFFAMRSMSAPDGTPINAVFGLGMTLQKFLNEHKPELVACCFDAGAKTFRNELFPDFQECRQGLAFGSAAGRRFVTGFRGAYGATRCTCLEDGWALSIDAGLG